MSIIEIPLRNDIDNYEFTIDLDGTTYKFEIVWNNRTSVWSMIIKDDESNVILGAIPLVVNSDLLGRFKMDNLPKGILSLYDSSGKNIEAVKADLGVRCVLIYQEAI